MDLKDASAYSSKKNEITERISGQLVFYVNGKLVSIFNIFVSATIIVASLMKKWINK